LKYKLLRLLKKLGSRNKPRTLERILTRLADGWLKMLEHVKRQWTDVANKMKM
ncbi:unnamed protein product, partial [Aphanomyces euteiches]